MKILLMLAILALSGCSSSEDEIAQSITSVMRACAKPASVTMTITAWSNSVMVYCPELKPERPRPKKE